MMQRLQCNVFMLSYRGYDISYFYYICTIQTCSSQYFMGSNVLIFFICDTSKPEFLYRYGESDGYPSQKGITYDAQVCWFLHVYFTDFACSQFLQISCLLGCTWSSSSEEGHWHNQDSYLWKIFRRCCWSSSCQKQSWQGNHLYPICYSYCCRKLRNRLLYSLCYWMDGIPISVQNFILVPV